MLFLFLYYFKYNFASYIGLPKLVLQNGYEYYFFVPWHNIPNYHNNVLQSISVVLKPVNCDSGICVMVGLVDRDWIKEFICSRC